jgi:hypothetical protein
VRLLFLLDSYRLIGKLTNFWYLQEFILYKLTVTSSTSGQLEKPDEVILSVDCRVFHVCTRKFICLLLRVFKGIMFE